MHRTQNTHSGDKSFYFQRLFRNNLDSFDTDGVYTLCQKYVV